MSHTNICHYIMPRFIIFLVPSYNRQSSLFFFTVKLFFSCSALWKPQPPPPRNIFFFVQMRMICLLFTFFLYYSMSNTAIDLQKKTNYCCQHALWSFLSNAERNPDLWCTNYAFCSTS